MTISVESIKNSAAVKIGNITSKIQLKSESNQNAILSKLSTFDKTQTDVLKNATDKLDKTVFNASDKMDKANEKLDAISDKANKSLESLDKGLDKLEEFEKKYLD